LVLYLAFDPLDKAFKSFSVLPSPEFLANPLSLDFEGFERNSRGGWPSRSPICKEKCFYGIIIVEELRN